MHEAVQDGGGHGVVAEVLAQSWMTRLEVTTSVINKGTLRMEFQAGSYSTTRIARRARAASRAFYGALLSYELARR